jgi:hypothetical protein
MLVGKSRLSSAGRSVALATVAALALTAAEPSMALAASKPAGTDVSVAAHPGLTDISARRKAVRHRHHRGNNAGAAAAAAAFAGIVGTGLAIAAERSRRDYYYDHYGYYGGPDYYGGPGYYGGAPYYYGW